MIFFLAKIGFMELEQKEEVGSFYKSAYTLDEAADLLGRAMGAGVEDEVSAVRVAIRRALLKMEGEMDTAEFARMIGLVFRGANTVGHLLKTKRMINGESADTIVGSLAQILLELRDERGWEI
jgi:ribosomal protein S9